MERWGFLVMLNVFYFILSVFDKGSRSETEFICSQIFLAAALMVSK